MKIEILQEWYETMIKSEVISLISIFSSFSIWAKLFNKQVYEAIFSQMISCKTYFES